MQMRGGALDVCQSAAEDGRVPIFTLLSGWKTVSTSLIFYPPLKLDLYLLRSPTESLPLSIFLLPSLINFTPTVSLSRWQTSRLPGDQTDQLILRSLSPSLIYTHSSCVTARQVTLGTHARTHTHANTHK